MENMIIYTDYITNFYLSSWSIMMGPLLCVATLSLIFILFHLNPFFTTIWCLWSTFCTKVNTVCLASGLEKQNFYQLKGFFPLNDSMWLGHRAQVHSGQFAAVLQFLMFFLSHYGVWFLKRKTRMNTRLIFFLFFLFTYGSDLKNSNINICIKIAVYDQTSPSFEGYCQRHIMCSDFQE